MNKLITGRMFTAFLLICTNGIYGQSLQNQIPKVEFIKKAPEKNLNNSDRSGDFENIYILINNKTQSPLELYHSPIAGQLITGLAGYQELDSTITHTWYEANNKWVNSARTEYTYDVFGNRTRNIFYGWNDTASVWVGVVKNEFTFKSNNIAQCIEYDWEDYDWNDWRKTEYTCMENGKKTQYISSLKEITTGRWDLMEKAEFSYEFPDNLAMTIVYLWSDNKWISYNKESYTYDVNGHMTLYSGYHWNSELSEWNFLEKTEYINDPDGNLTSETSYISKSNDWIPNYKVEYTLDNNAKRTLEIWYKWNVYSGKWVAYLKDEIAYGADETKAWSIQYQWDETTARWTGNTKTFYYYSGHNVTYIPQLPENNILVYPNPASEFIIFNLPEISQSATVELFNNEGKKVSEQYLPISGQISVNHLAKGLYVYRIMNSGSIFSGQIVIQ